MVIKKLTFYLFTLSLFLLLPLYFSPCLAQNQLKENSLFDNNLSNDFFQDRNSSTSGAPSEIEQLESATGQQFPKDKRFWEFQRWYKEHSVLSLIVSGNDNEHLLNALAKLLLLKTKQKVLVGQVVIVGGGANILGVDLNQLKNLEILKNPELNPPTDIKLRPTEYAELIRRLKLNSTSTESTAEIVSRLNIKNSPTWVVRYQGKDYIYEGNIDPTKLFSKNGKFLKGTGSRL